MHLVWMTLPSGEVPGRGALIHRITSDRGLRAPVPVALKVTERSGDVSPTDTPRTLRDALTSLDEAGDIGWRASAGEASAVVGPVTMGRRRGLVLRFIQRDFHEFDSAVTGGVLGLIAALREACDAREVMWARDFSAASMLEILDSDPAQLPFGALDDVVAVADVHAELFARMLEFEAFETWAGGLRFAAVRWARPRH